LRILLRTTVGTRRTLLRLDKQRTSERELELWSFNPLK
jgi:hypothetical protein